VAHSVWERMGRMDMDVREMALREKITPKRNRFGTGTPLRG